MELFPQIFEVPREHFRRHLDLEENHRILFSGRFGVGKTTFLKHFFEDSAFAEKYNCFHLYPVNYSILENADIMQHIKYDILFEMIIKHMIQFPNIKMTEAQLIHDFAFLNFDEILKRFVSFLPKLGKNTFTVYKAIKDTVNKDYKAFKTTNENWNPEYLQELETFINEFHNENSLYEGDLITQIIISTLQQQKLDTDGNDNKKQNVLIIDDLDRIDPHHIFRLFNVFAAHFDNRMGEQWNKFELDKVIFVCNIENVRSIFHHFYGQNTNFNGYIDKFYSKETFRFDNRENLEGIIRNILESITIKIDGDEFPPKASRYWEVLNEILEYIFLDIINSKYVNLRQFFRHRIIELKTKKININTHTFHNVNFIYVIIIDILMKYFDDIEFLKNVLKNTIITDASNRDYSAYHDGDLLILSDLDNAITIDLNKVTEDIFKDIPRKKYYINNNQFVEYNLVRKQYDGAKYITYNIGGELTDLFRLDFYELLLKAIENLEKVKYFN